MWIRSCEDSKQAAGVRLGTVQARTHVQVAFACQRSTLLAQHKLRLTMQHVYGQVILVMNVLTVTLHSGPQALLQATTLPPVGFTITLIHLRV